MTSPDTRVLCAIDPTTPLGVTLGEFADAIEKTVFYGTRIFCSCVDSTEEREDDVLPPVMLFRHFLELADSIPHLIRVGIVDPCVVVQRAMLETLLAFEYMLQADTKRRCFAYLVCELHRRLEVVDSWDPNTDAGKQALRAIKGDKYTVDVPLPALQEVSPRRDSLRAQLQSPRYQEAETEYQRLKAMTKRRPKWFALFDGPHSIEDLAARVGSSGLYEVFYRLWSGVAHSTHIVEGRVTNAQGHPAILALRQPINAQRTASMSLSMAIRLYTVALDYFCPTTKREFQDWYIQHLRATYRRLAGDHIIEVKHSN
jgi:hypothetical protein